MRARSPIARAAARILAPFRGVREWTGAQTSRLTAIWTTTRRSANRDLEASLGKLRARAREARRNDPLVARYAALCIEGILGPDGLTLQAQVPSARGINDTLSRQCEALWYEWVTAAGVDGAPLDAIARQLVETWRIEGEALVEVVIDERLPMGVGVQLLDPDLLDETYTVPRQRETGVTITQGVETDALGRVVACHVWTAHPSDAIARERRRVPAERLRLVAHRTRPGQTRGVTPLAPVLYRLDMLNGLQESLVTLHRATAAKMGFLVNKNGEGYPLQPTADGAAIQWEAAPLAIEQLPPGYEFQGWDPGQPGQQYEPMIRELKREISAGVGVSYSSITGDLSQANYGSNRQGLIAERDGWRLLQRELVPVWQWLYEHVLAAARMRGRVQLPSGLSPAQLATATWHGRRWDWIDPAKDIAAIKEAIGAGLSTLTRECNARGIDLRELLTERAAELQLAASLGVPLDTTPAPLPVTAADVPPPLLQLVANG